MRRSRQLLAVLLLTFPWIGRCAATPHDSAYAEGYEADSSSVGPACLEWPHSWAVSWSETDLPPIPTSYAVLDAAKAVTVDSSGNAYVAGYYSNVEVDEAEAPSEPSSKQGMYLMRFDQTGRLIWTLKWPRWLSSSLVHLQFTAPDSLYFAGNFGINVDFDPGPGTEERTANGECDLVLCKLNTDGEFDWARTWGRAGPSWHRGEEVFAMATLGSGDIALIGELEDPPEVQPGSDIVPDLDRGKRTTFLSVFSADGNQRSIRTFGGSGWMSPESLDIDPTDCIYILSLVSGEIDLDPGPRRRVEAVPEGGAYALSKLNPACDLEWVRLFSSIRGGAMILDDEGNALLSGSFCDDCEIDASFGVGEASGRAFLALYDRQGDSVWTRLWGTPSTSYEVCGVTVGAHGAIVVAGDCLPKGLSWDLEYDARDIFVQRFSATGEPTWDCSFGSATGDSALDLAVDSLGSIFVCGYFSGILHFCPHLRLPDLVPASGTDAFLIRVPPGAEAGA